MRKFRIMQIDDDCFIVQEEQIKYDDATLTTWREWKTLKEFNTILECENYIEKQKFYPIIIKQITI